MDDNALANLVVKYVFDQQRGGQRGHVSKERAKCKLGLVCRMDY
jgi:hypothetical protein